jgi:hypothetical protein
MLPKPAAAKHLTSTIGNSRDCSVNSTLGSPIVKDCISATSGQPTPSSTTCEASETGFFCAGVRSLHLQLDRSSGNFQATALCGPEVHDEVCVSKGAHAEQER